MPLESLIKHEPEIRRAKAKSYVASCNRAVHEVPWINQREGNTGPIYIAMEFAEQAYQAHGLPYEGGLSKLNTYDPRRFTWVYDEQGEADNCVKLRDDHTGKLAPWPHWAG